MKGANPTGRWTSTTPFLFSADAAVFWLSVRIGLILVGALLTSRTRPLKPEEVRDVTNITRRIAAILLLQPNLDHNYQTIKAAPFDWPKP